MAPVLTQGMPPVVACRTGGGTTEMLAALIECRTSGLSAEVKRHTAVSMGPTFTAAGLRDLMRAAAAPLGQSSSGETVLAADGGGTEDPGDRWVEGPNGAL